MHKFKFYLRDSGDISVGLMPWESKVTLTIEDYKHDADFEVYIRDALADYFDCQCLTNEQMLQEEEVINSILEEL